ncbi:Rhomboid family protein [Rippkaea orientalis PCC 8801]|uniref:Rhomboid family protein n=1 Tax=Rippkaea orientalis (strain PCC 8801 / RF-1) TaxID=41431 RepID=B7JZF1_RIPO1|nr:rhomboid family intramembrane serine protease [Rippkaea orientalis]ACK67362.1 Rhomboid family protein [Rippkaea orientalis PCC 8801]
MRTKRAKITWFLVGLNVLYFLLEILLGGSDNINTIYTLGALVPQVVVQGEVWRLLTANFLHYSWLHLFVNMIGLYFLGRLVELKFGVFRYLIIYFVSGLGAMAAFTYFAITTNDTDYILLGASGAIMGLVGSITALFLQNFWQERSRIATRRLQFILLSIGLQFVFDFFIPEVSFLSHLFGLIIGFFVGLILLILSNL